MLGRFDKLVFHLIRNFRNFRMAFLMHQPTKQIVLFHQIALVNVRNTTLEENLNQKCHYCHGILILNLQTHDCRNFVDTPFGSFFVIIDFHESNVVLITLVINVLQFSEHLLRYLVVLVVCNKITV